MGREFELKYAADPRQQEKILACYDSFETIAMETTYYDTPDGALSARRFTLRRRMENGESVCTVKTPADGHGRGEWECRCAEIEAAVPLLCDLGAPRELQQWCKDGLTEICGARFTRHAKTLTVEDATVELAVDAGVLLGGGRKEPLCEVEVELKAGSEAAASCFAAQFAAEFGLRTEKNSKFRRALRLAKGEDYGTAG